jgi:hypothetical protein
MQVSNDKTPSCLKYDKVAGSHHGIKMVWWWHSGEGTEMLARYGAAVENLVRAGRKLSQQKKRGAGESREEKNRPLEWN